MSPPLLTDDEIRLTAEAFLRLRSQNAVASEFGMSRSAVQNRLRHAAMRGLLGTAPVLPGFELAGTTTTRDADGNTVRETIRQRPERPAATPIPPGHVVKGVSRFTDGAGNVIGEWVKTREGVDPKAFADAVREALVGYEPQRIKAPEPGDADILTVYALPDLHLGMLAWGEESGENYDIAIAARTIRGMVADLVAQSRPSRQAIVLGLGDTFHSNDRTAMTPRSGHILDVDGRWPKVLRTGAEIALDLTHLVAEKHHDVTVRFIPGNHDPDAAMALTVALALYFGRESDRVWVDDDPGLHFYHRFGKVLIGATHGHTMKPDRMAMMLAADRPNDWGETLYRHMFFGHVHHEQALEVGAVRVESFNSPAAKDAHAHGGGWRAGRSLTAITFHRERGEIGRHRVNLPPPPQRERPRVRVKAGRER